MRTFVTETTVSHGCKPSDLAGYVEVSILVFAGRANPASPCVYSWAHTYCSWATYWRVVEHKHLTNPPQYGSTKGTLSPTSWAGRLVKAKHQSVIEAGTVRAEIQT